MKEQSFNGLPTPSAFFDPDTFSWRTSKDSLLKEDLTSLERLKPFGMTVAGRLYELATPEHLISVRDGSRLPNLPTPTASQPGGTPERHLERKNSIDGANRTKATDLRMALEQTLLPPPTAWVQDEVDMEKYLARRERVKKEANNGNGFGMTLDMTVRLLPTPTTQDAANNAGPAQWERNSLPLNCIAVQIGENGSLPLEDAKPSSGEPPHPPSSTAS